MSSAELKSLQVRLGDTITEIAQAEEVLASARERLSVLKNRKHNLLVNIDKLTTENDKIVVSEHAILRYIERQFGVKSDDIAEQITKGYENAIRTIKSGQITRSDGVRLVIKNNVIITVVVTPED